MFAVLLLWKTFWLHIYTFL